MKKFFPIFICMFLLLTSCGENNKFSLEEKYYNNGNFIEIDSNALNDLISNKESFALFIYQPLCNTSSNFESILKEFSNKHKISFYKISFSNIKETDISECVRYYPSFIIYNNGEIIDYLDANSDKDINSYKSLNGFEKWFLKYIKK